MNTNITPKQQQTLTIGKIPLMFASDPFYQDTCFIIDKKIYEYPEEKLNDFRHTMGKASKDFAERFVKEVNPSSLSDIGQLVVRGFTYMFIKSTELLHLFEFDNSNKFNIQIDLYADLDCDQILLPTGVQAHIDELTEKIVGCINYSIQMVEEVADTSELTVQELTSILLLSATELAHQNYLRLDVDEDGEII
jgi:hypothetical protein